MGFTLLYFIIMLLSERVLVLRMFFNRRKLKKFYLRYKNEEYNREFLRALIRDIRNGRGKDKMSGMQKYIVCITIFSGISYYLGNQHLIMISNTAMSVTLMTMGLLLLIYEVLYITIK